LSDDKDYDDFIEEFKYTKAESILKLYVRLCREGEVSLAQQMEETILVAIRVCEKKIIDLDELLEEQGEIQPLKITEEEWKILSKDEITAENLNKKKFEARLSKYESGAKPKKTGKKKAKRKIIDVKALSSDKEAVSRAKTTPLEQREENMPHETLTIKYNNRHQNKGRKTRTTSRTNEKP